MGYDGDVVLSVNIISYFEGQGTIGQCDCGVPKTVPEMLNSVFGEGVDGKVYLNVASITT